MKIKPVMVKPVTSRRRESIAFASRTWNVLRNVTLLLLIGVVGCESGSEHAFEETPVHWRFAIEEPLGSVQDAYAQRFKQLIEERLGGEIEVTIYPYGTLGTSDQITEQLHLDVVQFAMASPGHVGKLIPEIQVFLLHFLFSDDPKVNNKALNEDPQLFEAIDSLYARKNFRLLSIFSEGWQVWTTDRPIQKPSDFEGVKMRVMTSPLLIAAYAAYGASPTPMPYGEVYSALQLNMIDGQENPIFAIQEMSFYEVTDWMIFPKHAPFITTVITNREFYGSLATDEKSLVDEVVSEMNGYILEEQQAYNRERLDLIRERKPDLNIITELTPEERDAFRAASQVVREQYKAMAGKSGSDLLATLERAVAKHQAVLEDD